ncbi:MAG: hypothetical protein IE916_02440 [Epsilonproteobacteria bacterium]|nr:hypothetical protein [Campylobacterota bacterium]
MIADDKGYKINAKGERVKQGTVQHYGGQMFDGLKSGFKLGSDFLLESMGAERLSNTSNSPSNPSQHNDPETKGNGPQNNTNDISHNDLLNSDKNIVPNQGDTSKPLEQLKAQQDINMTPAQLAKERQTAAQANMKEPMMTTHVEQRKERKERKERGRFLSYTRA